MNVDEAMSIVVQGVVASAVREQLNWENYPEIGERDWEEIRRRALAVMVPPITFRAAYEIIAARAEHLPSYRGRPPFEDAILGDNTGPSEEGPVSLVEGS
jgi:hypothetical protein